MPSNDESLECVFLHDGACDLNGEKCTHCSLQLKKITGLDYKDHYFIYEKRQEARNEKRPKYVAIAISILAFVLSAYNAFYVPAAKAHQPKYYYLDTLSVPVLKQLGTADSTLSKIDPLVGMRFSDLNRMKILLHSRVATKEFSPLYPRVLQLLRDE